MTATQQPSVTQAEALTKIRNRLQLAEYEEPLLAVPDGTVSVEIADLRAVINGFEAMRDGLALGRRTWIERWYGSGSEKGSAICSVNNVGGHGGVIAYLAGNEATHQQARRLVTAHNASTDELRAENERLREAAQNLIDRKFATYKARNGRDVGIQGDDGEMCWIVHSDDIFTLEAALSTQASAEGGV